MAILVGDKVLIQLAEILKNNTRTTDFIGRWGGEEFIIICTKTKRIEALKVAENVKNIIESYNNFKGIGNITASFGVTTFNESDTITSFLSRVDDAMYHSKKQGKNRITFK